MASSSQGPLSWLLLLFLVLVAAALWLVDTESLLRSTRPSYAWVTVAIMWIEIAALISALIRRYRLGRRGLGLAIAISFAAAAVNAIGAGLMLPAIVMG
jgi:hypothetical protein